MECFYEPWSSCTVTDAVGADLAGLGMEAIARLFPAVRDDGFIVHPNGTLTPPLPLDSYRVVVLHHTGHNVRASKFIPSVLQPLLSCSPVDKGKEYYWWRAVSAAYYLRPNRATLDFISTFRSLSLSSEEGCLSMYVRHGDKGAEMKVVPFRSYVAAANQMYERGLIPHTHKDRKFPIFLGTEDPMVIEEAKYLDSTSSRWRVEYTTLLSRYGTAARYEKKVLKKAKIEVEHHDLEYISMILNLDYAVRCDAWVCTLASNWCRVIDELRATVGGKANKPYADLSMETCPEPPCIGRGISWFGW
eukprot:CAMPEP_0182439738 /NCGR_PEP_ID=MMETSP1167-20130531/86616_1 /TAXON_ID=2988 /ORGANISM="Mallomonas Sp, Strain CCMP3275" /LENGTH=302 /DNA_ID=CAMNT_0024633499 /DNA_START=499 /DNA_END=1404 /DNA_ORIENTATION=-